MRGRLELGDVHQPVWSQGLGNPIVVRQSLAGPHTGEDFPAGNCKALRRKKSPKNRFAIASKPSFGAGGRIPFIR